MVKMCSKTLYTCAILLSIFISVKSWNTCEQTSFCTRIRNKAPDNLTYALNLNSLKNLKTSITANLINIKTQSTLLFTFTHIYHNSARIVVNEKNPTHSRHQVPEALNGEPQTAPLKILNTSEHQVTLEFGDNQAILYASPFKIELYKDGNIMTIINSKGLLTFEEREPNVGIAVDVAFPGSQRAYGIPQHADRLSLRSTAPGGLDPYRLYNTDHGGYSPSSTESLYGAIPVLYAHSPTKSSGVFWLNSAQTWVDITNENNVVNAFFMSETGVLDLFVLMGPTLEATVKQYVNLTGTAPLPQYFTLGYHQSRYSYMSQEEVTTVIDEFDAHDLPLDTIWLDIDYTNEKKYFTWDPVRYSNPLAMQEHLVATGRKLVAIIDPHIKREEGYFVNDVALSKGYYVKTSNGSIYEGKCWPGVSSYIDFLNPKAQAYYSSLYLLENFKGSTENLYVWNDMNEPAVFESDELTMPGDLVHYGGWQHRDVHNIYGFHQTIGTFKGLMDRSKNKTRPFILTRSHFAGSQRYAAMWTGDNQATWDYLAVSIPMCLTQALAGMSFCGADVAGFGGIPDDELYQRWYQAGAWLPFYRAHSAIDVPRREPYLYPTDIQNRVRTVLRQRYAHLPVWYTLWYEHERNGTPVILPLTYLYPEDPNVLDIDDHILVGTDILVRPITEKGASTVEIYLPGGASQTWYNIDEGYKPYSGTGLHRIPVTLDSLPVFYKGGSIIARKDVPRTSSVHTHKDSYTLIICLDEGGTASGQLYVDDYTSFNYKNKEYFYVQLNFSDNTLHASKIDTEANYKGVADISTIVIVRAPTKLTGANLITNASNNEKLAISYDNLNEHSLTMTGFSASLEEPFEIKLF